MGIDEARSVFDNSDYIEEESDKTPKRKTAGSRTKSQQGLHSNLEALCRHIDAEQPVHKTEFIGGIFPAGYVTLIVAPPGTGKSLALQRMMADLSKGGSFFGGVADKQPKRACLLLAGELGLAGYNERAHTFSDMMPDPQLFTIIDQNEAEGNGLPLSIDTEQGQNNIRTLISCRHWDILAVDSFSSFFDGKENDNTEARKAFKFLASLAAMHSIALIVTHHSRKRLSSEQSKPLTLDDVVGASAINRFVHTVAAIEYVKQFNHNRIVCLKSWHKKFKPFAFSVKNGLYNNGSPYLAIDLDPGEITEEKLNHNAGIPAWKTIVLAFLQGRGKTGASNAEILRALGPEGKDAKVTNARLTKMANDGDIIKLDRGRYAIPDEH